MKVDHRVLAVDPGDKRIGLAISDLTATIANPLKVIQHVQRLKDAQTIAALAVENDVKIIVVGQALTIDGEPTPSGRKAARLADAIRSVTDIPVCLWDETGSTKIAQQARALMGGSKKSRRGHMDELAATVILQSFLDANSETNLPLDLP
jgi:putative Holliday junction resolvase